MRVSANTQLIVKHTCTLYALCVFFCESSMTIILQVAVQRLPDSLRIR